MLSVMAVIAVAVGCSVLLIVSATVGIVVWLRLRQDRLSLAMAQARLTRSVPTAGLNSIRESPEDSPLPTYGQLPYGIPHDWMPLGSQETFQLSISQVKPPSPQPTKEKSRSIRRSISKSLSKRLSLSRGNQKHLPLGSLTTLADTIENTSSGNLPDAREKEPTSAVEGFSELPTEITPRATPEREREDSMQADAISRPLSTAWPLLASDRISSVIGGQPMFEQQSSRVRNGSITAQTAGTVPDLPMPPPPVTHARPYQFPRDDSLMRLSSMSLETANSSILDDGMRSVDGEFNSPALPPCPTFTPFSPYDIVIGGSVARDCASQRRSHSQRLSSSTARLTFASSDSCKMELSDPSPRRSLTTRESPQPSEWINQLPRRSETVLSPSGSRNSLTQPNGRPNSSSSFINPNARHSGSSGQSHFARQQRCSMYDTSQMQTAPSMRTDDMTRVIQSQSPGRMKESPGRAPLPSAMKSAHGHRKGHRRQNCVRISIHPPITFGGPAFSPMLEEPEETAESENELNLSSTQQPRPQWGSPSPGRGSGSSRRHSRNRSTGSIQDRGSVLNNSPGTNARISLSSISRKRPHSRTSSADDVFMSENEATIPQRIFSSPPPEERYSLSRTPSPDKPEPLWSLPPSDGFSGSSPKFPTNASTGSPRRSAIRGPRNQPSKQERDSAPPVTITFTGENNSSTTAPPSGRPMTYLTPSPSGKDVRRSITLLRRMNSDAWDDESKQYRRMGGSPSVMTLREKKITTPPVSNRNSAALSASSVTIWEDAGEDNVSTQPQRRTKTFSVLERIDSEGVTENAADDTNSPEAITIRAVPPSSSVVEIDEDDKSDSPNRPSAALTPIKKSTGFVVGSCAATPGSLYDRDGFLKE